MQAVCRPALGGKLRAGSRVEDQDVLRRNVLEIAGHALDFTVEPAIDDQKTRSSLIDDAGESVSPQAGVDAEQREPPDPASTEQRGEFEMVFQKHRDVSGVFVVDSAEAPAQKTGHANRLVAKPAIRPRAVVLAKEDFVRRHWMFGARLDLSAEC